MTNPALTVRATRPRADSVRARMSPRPDPLSWHPLREALEHNAKKDLELVERAAEEILDDLEAD